MRRATLTLSLLCALALSVSVQAISFQHGFFRTQATKGDPWQGTATLTQEKYTITVYPDYLDVELECVFEAGGSEPKEHADALEIVGNMNLVENSSVTGLITWWKGDILKGKLKTTETARQEYEDVVDRDSSSVSPPRDPVLLEKVWGNNYDISIYPIEFGGTRKVRLRYVVPGYQVDGKMKITYPHAFSDNATVSIQKGDGIKGYTLETSEQPIFFDNSTSLSSDSYQLRAYGASASLTGLSYIVPELEESSEGSVMYVGAFTAENLSGEMAHLVTAKGQEKLLQTSLDQDFVILWRWNHPNILAKHAGQIVRQSELLLQFLDKLESVNKRAALIIDKQGDQRVSFELDSRGGDEFKRMQAYLEELKNQEIVEPSYTTSDYRQDLELDRQQAFEEFEQALQAALSLFENSGESTLKHLLLVTAGPRFVWSDYAENDTIEWDESIDVDMLSSYVSQSYQDPWSFHYADDLYWPGVNLTRFVNMYSTLTVRATLENGTHSFDLLTSLDKKPENYYYYPRATTEAHLYSSLPLNKNITWTIQMGEQTVTQFDETPLVVNHTDAKQYARLLGASPHLNPLTDHMPSSLASSLGFIDGKYSLVALEEDALPEEIALQYEQSGVPLLAAADIFAAEDEVVDMPIDSWLAANPPRPIRDYRHQYYPIIMYDSFITPGLPDVRWEETLDGAPARIAAPRVETISSLTEKMQPDYNASAIAPHNQASQKLHGSMMLQMREGSLVLDLSQFTSVEQSQITIILYDLKGRVIRIWKPSGRDQFMLPLKQLGLSNGAYLVRVKGVNVNLTRKIFIK